MPKQFIKIHVDSDSVIEEVDKEMDKIVEDIFNNSQLKIVDKKIVDEGTLLKSGNIIRNFLHKVIIYPVPYAESIEFGRLPGSMPPVEPLKDWLRRKQIATEEVQINKIAWAIAKDIEKNGQEPRPFLSPAIDYVRLKR